MPHTPGPWRVDDNPSGPYLVLTNEQPIAHDAVAYVAEDRTQVFSKTIGQDVARANANLIAAAPEMLAALQAIRHQLLVGEASDGDARDIAKCAEMATEAIYKAIGE